MRKNTVTFGLCIILLACLLIMPSAANIRPALAQSWFIYGAAYQAGGPATLYTINPATGGATAVGPIGFNRCGGMDVNNSGTLYATCERSDGTSVLITINPETGAGTEVGPTGFAYSVFDISFRNADSHALHVSFIEPDNCVSLGTINTQTGAGTIVGDTQTCEPGNGIAFSPGDILYHVHTQYETTNGRLHRLNPGTGVATFLRPLVFPDGFEFPRINAMDYGPGSSTLYASLNTGSGGSGPNFLATVNTSTGVVTIIGQTVNGLDAIACMGMPVGGHVYPVNKLAVIAPWFALVLVLAISGGILVIRRRYAN